MRKALLLLATAALAAGPALTGPAVARDRGERADLSANQIANEADARTARMKVDLRLTPDQEKNWAGFESAMRDMGKKQAAQRFRRRHRPDAQAGRCADRALQRLEEARRRRPAALCQPR